MFLQQKMEIEKEILNDANDGKSKSLIEVKVATKEQVFSPYSYSGDKLNSEFCDYIFEKAKIAPLTEDISIKIYANENIDANEIERTVKSHYRTEYREAKREMKRTVSIAANGNTPIYKFAYQGKDIAFYLSAIGSTATSEYLIEANWLTGASKFIMFGSAGSLDGEKTTNKYVIPTEAYRDEGMSYHYAPPSDYIKIRNSDKIKALFDMWNIPNVQGRVWTTDAMLRETVGQVALRKKDGCIAVEMEVAGVQAVCDFYNFELYNFLVTGDVLCENSYDNSQLPDANHNLDKLQIALKLAVHI